MNLHALVRDFQALYARHPDGAVRAPGRVNLIGEHTDYNDGFVLPIAINHKTVAFYARRPDRVVQFASKQADSQIVSLDLSAPIAPAEPSWANYPRGVTAGLLAAAVPLTGADVLFDSDLPLGGGLSSSAALEVATALALLHAARRPDALAPADLARLCQIAEHDFAGAPCGIMDQSVAIMARFGHALLLDCRSNQTRQVHFDDPAVTLLVADTQVKHAISDGGYALRRQQCHAAAASLGAEALRDVDLPVLQAAAKAGKLDPAQLRRARHVVTEISRTLDAAGALEVGGYDHFGRLMVASHLSLRDDYEVSCPELDAIVDAAVAARGVFGARMTGGGFGGCAIILTRADQAETVTAAIQKDFADRFGRRCPIFATPAAPAAGPLPLP